MIKRYTNVITSQQDLKQIKEMTNTFSSKRSWHFQGSDSTSQTSFFISYLDQLEVDLFYKNFQPIVQNYDSSNFTLERAYINCHPAYIGGDWHTDGDSGITILYYPDTDLNFGLEGGTEFEHHGVENYINNSIILFPANISHRAVEHTVRGRYRFSIAIKLKYI